MVFCKRFVRKELGNFYCNKRGSVVCLYNINVYKGLLPKSACFLLVQNITLKRKKMNKKNE